MIVLAGTGVAAGVGVGVGVPPPEEPQPVISRPISRQAAALAASLLEALRPN